MNQISTPENFPALSTAISKLSYGIHCSVTDLIQIIKVSDELWGETPSGNIEISMDYSDEDGKVFGLVFVMSAETGFKLEHKLGVLPERWNLKVFNKALYDFAYFLTQWAPVHSIVFCPQMNPRNRYQLSDLKESYESQWGWVINIRGIYNDSDEFNNGLNLFDEELLMA